jgi:hypothetical protein
MKKSELGTLIIGSQIENKKNNEVFTINNITEIDSKVKYQLSNDKTITASSMLRWYNLVQPETVEQVELPIAPVETVEPEEQVEPETEQPTSEVETVQPEPVEPDTVEKEKIEQLVDEEVDSVKLTPLETEAMWILKTNEYGNCFDRSDGIASTWDFVVTENISCGIQGAKGVLGSLVRKGLVIIDTEGEYNTSSKQYDHSISLTDLGYKVGLKALETFNPDNIKPTAPKQVNVNTSNDLANEIFDYFTTQQNTFTLKHNTDHSVIKLGRKKLVEIYVSNTEVTVAVRQELYSEDEQANLDNSRIVKDYAFTLKFKVHSLDEFKAVVNRASVYVPVKK